MGYAFESMENMDFCPAPDAAATPRTIYASEDGIVMCYGTTVPTDAATGYAPGCLFFHLDGAAGGVQYVNEGTKASCDFNASISREFAPFAENTGRSYGFQVVGDNFFTGVAGAQEYLVHFEGSKDVVASGDAYGGILKISGGNDAVQTVAGYVFRSLNVNTSNDGTLGTIENFIGAKNDEGTATNVIALSIRAENYGLNTGSGTTFGGLDILLTPEGAMAETSWGIRIRNNNASLATAVESVINISETGANTGFTYLMKVGAAADIGAYVSTGNAPALATGDLMIPIRVGSATYYLVGFADTGV